MPLEITLNINANNACSFFGHRKIQLTSILKSTLFKLIEDLITKNNVTIFLFGSRSEFDDLCHLIVSDLKNKYPQIKQIAFTCKHEACILQKDLNKWNEAYKSILSIESNLIAVDYEYKDSDNFCAGKASYIKRNQSMIDLSSYCVFYYNHKVNSKGNSGTYIAYNYAKKKEKTIINVCEIIKNDTQ